MDTNTPVATSALGTKPVVVEIPSHVVYDFEKLYNWKFRGIPAAQRPISLDGFIQNQIKDDGIAHAKYAEDSAYRMVEKMVFDAAQTLRISPQDAAQKLGVQLREK